jgi:hypothetical protein
MQHVTYATPLMKILLTLSSVAPASSPPSGQALELISSATSPSPALGRLPLQARFLQLFALASSIYVSGQFGTTAMTLSSEVCNPVSYLTLYL